MKIAKLKPIVASFLTFVLIVFLFLALPVSGEEKVYEDVVRLHILPSADTAEAQNTKILVRDAILTEYGEMLGGVENAAEAKALLTEKLPEIEVFVSNFLKEKGIDASVSVALEEKYFETRTYGDITLPRGNYHALTVKLGEGKGQNWWCVLYPSLCTDVAMGGTVELREGELSEGEAKLVTSSGYMLKFRTLEILESIFS